MARSHCPPDLTSPQPPQGCVEPLVFHLQMKCTVRLNPIATKIDARSTAGAKEAYRRQPRFPASSVPVLLERRPA
jgi:hypothetical protein